MAARLESTTAAKEAIARYQALISALPDMLHLLDSEGRFLDSHAGTVTPYLPLKDYLGKTVWEVFPKAFAEEIMLRIDTTLATGQIQEWEYALSEMPGARFEARMVQINVAQAGRGQVFAIIRDITKRKTLEDAIQASEQRFRLAFDASPNPKALSSVEDSRFIRVNASFCELMGYSEEELLGQTFKLITLPEDIEVSQQWIERSRLLKPEEPIRFLRKRYCRKDGSLVWGEVSVALLRESDETPTHFLIQVRDITTLLQTQNQLEQIVTDRTRQLQASNDALQSFAYAASHDLREPLNKITAFSVRLADKYAANLDIKGQQYLNIMQTAAIRMARLIDDLLEFSRAGTEPNPPVKINLNYLLKDVISDLEIPIAESQVQIELSELPTLRGNPARLRQVFQNLLSNAIKFKQPGRTPIIRITGRVEGEEAIITVRDNGIGFEQQYSERIFTIFTRLHTRFEYPGTGIGLALCRRILDQYGGKITAQGVPNEGATFIITVPVQGPESGSTSDPIC